MDDEQIISLLYKRSEAAVTQIHEKYGQFCMSLSRHILSDVRDAEECVNEAYLRVWNAIPPERPKSLKAYLARITRNISFDRYSYNTAGKRSTTLTDAFEELEPYLSSGRQRIDEIEDRELRLLINDFLRSLPQQARIFFVRRYWYGESIKEIAEACGAGEEKVKSSLFRTRNHLKNTLEKEGITI